MSDIEGKGAQGSTERVRATSEFQARSEYSEMVNGDQ
jgi:hypothetical protein